MEIQGSHLTSFFDALKGGDHHQQKTKIGAICLPEE